MKPFRLAVRATALLACVSLFAPAVAGRAIAAPSGVPPASTLSDGLDLSNIDPTCPACKDFFQFAVGKYAANHPIPGDHAELGNFDILQDHNLELEHAVLDDAAAHPADPSTDAGKLGIFYASCMDTAGRDAAGLAPLQPELAKIDAITDVPSLTAELASIQRFGANVVYGFGSSPDQKHSENTIAIVGEGQLGLPEREYYFRDDAKSTQERADYATFIGKFLALADATASGGPAATATASAAASAAPAADGTSPADLLALETAIAKVSETRAESRDPVAHYHRVSVADFEASAPGIAWQDFFNDIKAPAFSTIDVQEPKYTTAATSIVLSTPIATWKRYLRFRLLLTYAAALPTPLYDLYFSFYGTELSGVPKPRPQWQRCARSAAGDLQDIVSIVYAGKYFTPAAKARAVSLITNVHAALRDDLETLPWMTPHTRARAETKLSAMVKKIGYPDHPQDYSLLTLASGPYAQQLLAVNAFTSDVDMNRIGKPTDRTRWGMSAPTVNAYYSSDNNEIVFPAGILGHPFFDPMADDAVNYGAIGAVMGHETTHGFDDQGRQYNELGNLEDWWQTSDAVAFKARAKCIVDQFSSYATDGTHMNGEAVQGEAIADLGGITLAFRAFEKTPEAKTGKKIGGYTPEQRFFLSYAQVWAENQRASAAREQALTDPHPIAMWRVIGTLSNMPEFQKAFHCKAIDAMVRKVRCRIW